jgi:hypothetical protein
MSQIQFESNYGNFAYRFTAQIGEDVNPQTQYLAKQGLANIAYRVAGSSVDKALGVKERRSVEYSDEDGERINDAVSKKLKELEGKETMLSALKLSFAVTGKHEFGEAASPKVRATAFVDALLDNGDKEVQLRTMLAMFDKRAEDGDRDVLIEIAHAKGFGIQPPKKG